MEKIGIQGTELEKHATLSGGFQKAKFLGRESQKQREMWPLANEQ